MRSVNSSLCSVEPCTGHSLSAGAPLLARNATEGGVLFLYISTRLMISVKSHFYFALDALLSFTSSFLCKFKSSSKSRRVHTHPPPPAAHTGHRLSATRESAPLGSANEAETQRRKWLHVVELFSRIKHPFSEEAPPGLRRQRKLTRAKKLLMLTGSTKMDPQVI